MYICKLFITCGEQRSGDRSKQILVAELPFMKRRELNEGEDLLPPLLLSNPVSYLRCPRSLHFYCWSLILIHIWLSPL